MSLSVNHRLSIIDRARKDSRFALSLFEESIEELRKGEKEVAQSLLGILMGEKDPPSFKSLSKSQKSQSHLNTTTISTLTGSVKSELA